MDNDIYGWKTSWMTGHKNDLNRLELQERICVFHKVAVSNLWSFYDIKKRLKYSAVRRQATMRIHIMFA